eukprot:3470787-Prorocentrum_lima.AAC.1
MVRGVTRSSSSSGVLHTRRRSCASVMMMLGRTSSAMARIASVGVAVPCWLMAVCCRVPCPRLGRRMMP